MKKFKGYALVDRETDEILWRALSGYEIFEREPVAHRALETTFQPRGAGSKANKVIPVTITEGHEEKDCETCAGYTAEYPNNCTLEKSDKCMNNDHSLWQPITEDTP